MRKAKFPGWRHMTAAQRYNARKDAIFEEARRLGAFDEKPERSETERLETLRDARFEENYGPRD